MAYTSKRDRINMHKLTVLHHLMMETLDALKVNDEFKEEHKKAFEPAMEYVEKFLDNSLKDNDFPVTASMYLADLSNKVDTLMRKNYKPV